MNRAMIEFILVYHKIVGIVKDKMKKNTETQGRCWMLDRKNLKSNML